MLKNKAKIKASHKRDGRKHLKELGARADWVPGKEAIARDKLFDGYYRIQI